MGGGFCSTEKKAMAAGEIMLKVVALVTLPTAVQLLFVLFNAGHFKTWYTLVDPRGN
jgi:hypothetical protein